MTELERQRIIKAYEEYKPYFTRCNVTDLDIIRLEKYTIVWKKYRNGKLQEVQEIEPWNYAYIISAIGVFKQRVTSKCTLVGIGSIMNRLSWRDYDNAKMVDTFDFIKK